MSATIALLFSDEFGSSSTHLRPCPIVVLNAPFNMYFAPMVVLKSVE